MSDFWTSHWQIGFFVVIALLTSLPHLWRWWKKRTALQWPTTPGRIESAEIPPPAKVLGMTLTPAKNRVVKARLVYSYAPVGEQFRGKYERDFGREEEAQDFLRDLQGKAVEVHFDPRRPEKSVLSEPSLESLLAARAPVPSAAAAVSALPRWVRPLLVPVELLALAGLALSLWVHLNAVMGHVPDAMFMALHVGIFVVFFPAVLVAQKRTGYTGRRDFWKVALRGAPEWMRYLVYGFLGYAFINFFWTMTQLPTGHTSHAMTAVEWRLFSGHWMAFYWTSFAILYTAAIQPPPDAMVVAPTGSHCANGHLIAPEESFCSVCGGSRAY